MQRLISLFRDYPLGVWLLLGGVLMLRTGYMVAPFLTLFLTEARGLSPDRAGIILSGYGAGAILGSILGGVLADRLGRRPAMLVSLFGAGCLFPLGPFIDNPWALAFGLFCTGIFADIYRPAAMAAMADMVAEDRRVKVYALNYWVANIGSAAAPVLGGILAGFGFAALFIANGGIILAYGVIVLLLFREPPRVVETAPGTTVSSPWSVLRDPVVWTVSGGSILTAILFFQSYAMLPLEMRADGLSKTDYGMVIALNGLTVVALSLPIAHHVAKVDPRLALAVGALFFGGGMALTGLADTLVLYALTIMVWTIGEIIISPIAPTLLAKAAPPGQRALYQGTLTASWGWSSLIAPAAGGALYARDPDLLWLACAGLGIAAAIIFACTPRQRG
ncbi:MAG: hypothetical protein RLY86_328 [Pseudomonadota bacterium]|jgi:MFS family permease